MNRNQQCECRFIELYRNKSVQYVGEIIAKVTFRNEKSRGYIWWNNTKDSEKEIIRKAVSRLNGCDRSDWGEQFPVQAIIFKNLTEVNFTTTKPMQNNNRVFPVKSAENIEQLAEMIDGINWNQWLDTEN